MAKGSIINILFFSSAIFIGSYLSLEKISFNFVLTIELILIFLGLIFFFFKKEKVFIVFILLGIGIILGFLRSDYFWKNQYIFPEEYVGKEILIEGKIIQDPQYRIFNTHIVIKTDFGNILITTYSKEKYEYGDYLKVSGKLSRPESFITDNEKVFDYPKYLAVDRIYTIIKNAEIKDFQKGESSFPRFLFKIKHRFENVFDSFLKTDESALMKGIIVGSRESLSNELRDDFITTGTIHIVALSGYNVSIVAEGVINFLKSFLPQRLALSFGGIGIVLFILMTGAQTTAIRAGGMAILVLIARVFGRPYDAFRLLLIIGSLMILYNPNIIYDVSFHLSFLATFGIIFITPLIEKRIKFIKYFFIRELISGTLGAQIAVAPYIAYVMGTFSLVSFPVNLIVLPFIPIAMFLGIIGGVLGIILPVLSLPFIALGGEILSFVIWFVDISAKIPNASLSFDNINLTLVIGVYVLMCFLIFKIYKKVEE